MEEIQKTIPLQEVYEPKFVKGLLNLTDTCYQAIPDKQNQRNLVDLAQDAENKNRTVKFLLYFFIVGNRTFLAV